jgi:hypothetical protein
MQPSANLFRKRISPSAVRRRAAVRRRRQDVAAIGSPVLAACGVLALGLTGALPGSGLRAAPPAAHSVQAPKQFNMLVPFASFGWLPPAAHATGPKETGTVNLTQNYLERQGLALHTFASGVCYRMTHRPELNCTSIPGYPIRLYGSAPAVNGHAAYLVERSPQASIAWQYAPHGWAILWNRQTGPYSLGTMVRIAKNVKLNAHQPVEFAVQITKPPAGTAGLVNGLDYALRTGPLFAYQYDVFHHGDRALTLNVSSWGGSCPSAKHTVINGYVVHYWRYPGGTALCVEAHGLVIRMDGQTKPLATYPLHVFRHLKILGSNPKNWVKQPIG